MHTYYVLYIIHIKMNSLYNCSGLVGHQRAFDHVRIKLDFQTTKMNNFHPLSERLESIGIMGD